MAILDSQSKDRDVLSVQSVGKAFRVLQCFEAAGDLERELSLMDIVNDTGYDKSTAQRFTHTLVQEGYLRKNPQTRRYSLGFRVLDLAFSFLRRNAFIEMANPVLLDLCRATGERVGMSLYDGPTLIYAVRLQNKPDYYYASLVGRRVPTCFTAGGRAILAALEPEEADGIIAQSGQFPACTAKTILDPGIWREEMEKIRRNGYGVSSEEITYGEVGIGAAVLDRAGRPIAAVHVTGSLLDWTSDAFAKRYSIQMMEAVQRISHR